LDLILSMTRHHPISHDFRVIFQTIIIFIHIQTPLEEALPCMFRVKAKAKIIKMAITWGAGKNLAEVRIGAYRAKLIRELLKALAAKCSIFQLS
jgi:hypothetical protein